MHAWIYSHHTVCYFNDILSKALIALNKKISPKGSPEKFIDIIFSPEVFEKHITIGGHTIYLPCDGDLNYLMKMYCPSINEAKEIIGRRPELISLWKTHAEFEQIFAKKKNQNKRASVKARIHEILAPIIKKKEFIKRILVIPVKPKIELINNEKLFVSLMGTTVPYSDVILQYQPPNKENVSYFYVYIPRDCNKLVKKCVTAIQKTKTY